MKEKHSKNVISLDIIKGCNGMTSNDRKTSIPPPLFNSSKEINEPEPEMKLENQHEVAILCLLIYYFRLNAPLISRLPNSFIRKHLHSQFIVQKIIKVSKTPKEEMGIQMLIMLTS